MYEGRNYRHVCAVCLLANKQFISRIINHLMRYSYLRI